MEKDGKNEKRDREERKVEGDDERKIMKTTKKYNGKISENSTIDQQN